MKRDPNNKKPTKLLTAVTALLLAVGIVADVAMFGVFPSSLDKAFPGQNGDPELQKKTSYANGLSVAQKIEEEGAVLLKKCRRSAVGRNKPKNQSSGLCFRKSGLWRYGFRWQQLHCKPDRFCKSLYGCRF